MGFPNPIASNTAPGTSDHTSATCSSTIANTTLGNDDENGEGAYEFQQDHEEVHPPLADLDAVSEDSDDGSNTPGQEISEIYEPLAKRNPAMEFKREKFQRECHKLSKEHEEKLGVFCEFEFDFEDKNKAASITCPYCDLKLKVNRL